MEKPLKNQVALITGASRGIGRAIARHLGQMGANIAINYVRNEEAAKQCLEELLALGIKACTIQANVQNYQEIEALVTTTHQTFGAIDILVHNAAIGAFKPVHKLKPNQWDLSFEVNTQALLLLTQKVLPFMEQKGSGSIVALSSLGAHRVIPNYGAVGVSKAALECLIRYLAAELAPKGIRVNGVSGGPIETDALKFYPDYEKLKKEVLAKTPGGRIGQPEDIAKVVGFLVTPASAWIYGQVIIVDGGISLS